MANNKTLTADNAFNILNKISIFDDLTTAEKKTLSNFHWHFVLYETNDYLTDEHSLDKRFFILLSGGVNIIKEPHMQLITQLSPGEVIGEISFLTGEPRTASVLANTPSSALVIDQQLLAELQVITREKIKDQLILKMAKRLNRMNNKVSLGL